MSFVFAGTPEFAGRVLTHLDDIGRRPCLVVSQPDKPRGRGQKCCPPEAVVAAERLGIPHIQVDDINSAQTIASIAETGATAVVVAAFGQILRTPFLDRFLCLNVHASLLPAYRGAAPIERAIAAGERLTGVSIMRMAVGLDDGPWALQSAVAIGPRDDAGSVGRALALLGGEGIDQVLTGLVDGTVTWTEQGGGSTYASKLSPADVVLDFSRTAIAVHDQVRSLSPNIGARMSAGGLSLKIWRTWPRGLPGLDPSPTFAAAVEGHPGAIAVGEGRFLLGCAEGTVEILLVQPAGKGKMSTADFLRGYAGRLGEKADSAGSDSESRASE